MPKGIPLTPEEQDRRRHEIFHAALQVFLEKGFNETSMREIAAAAGMGKSTLYDYFQTKDDILVSMVEDEILDLTQEVQEIARRPIPAYDRLRLIAQRNLEMVLANREFYLKISFEVQRLGLESQQRIQTVRHAYQDLIRRLIEEGIHEGDFRPINSLLVARLLVTALTPTVFTSRPTGTPQEMLDEIFDVILRGIRA